MRVALAPLAETSISIDLEEGIVEVRTVYTRVPRSPLEASAVYPSARLLGNHHERLVERGLWSLIVAGALLAPPLSRVIDSPDLKPLEGLHWRIAARSFTRLRRVYREGATLEDALFILRAGFQGSKSFAKIVEYVSRLECGTGYKDRLVFGDDGLNAYYAVDAHVDRDAFLEEHMLVVRSGIVEKRVRPLEYTAPLRSSGGEYALLVRGESVEGGAYARLRAMNGLELTACGARLRVDGENILARMGDEAVEVVLPDQPISRRIASIYIDAFASGILSCKRGENVAEGERLVEVYEVLDGPLIAWGRLVTPPSMYNVYSSGMGGHEPPLARLLNSVSCLDVYKAGWLALASASMYTSCCRLRLRVYSGRKAFVQTRDAPRVTA